MNKNSKIFVAGHRGLVGSAIVRRLQKKGYENLLVKTHSQLDLSRQLETEQFFAAEKPDYVFLAAAKVGGILANNTYKADFIYNNIAIAANVIHASCRYGVKKLLNLGSSCIYPKFATQPMKESMLLTGELEPTNEPYAVAKIAAIKLCRYYNEQYGTNFLSVMPTNLYGPEDNFDLMDSHVLPAMMRKMHLTRLLSQGNFNQIVQDFIKFGNTSGAINGDKYQISTGSTEKEILRVLSYYGINIQSAPEAAISGKKTVPVSLTLWGTGSPYREFLYSEDLADAVIMLMEKYDYSEIGEFVNIGSGTDLTIKEIAFKIRDIVGFSGELHFDSSKPDGTPKKLLDVSRINNLGWKYSTKLEEGLKRFYSWYCAV